MKSLQHIAEAMQANKPLLGSTQEKPHLRESNEGASRSRDLGLIELAELIEQDKDDIAKLEEE